MSKAKDKTKHKGDSRSRFRLCVPPCPRYIMCGDTHSLCVVCLGVKHAESALEGERILLLRYARFAPGRLSLRREPLPALLTVLAPLRLCTRGVCSLIWRREWRWAVPYLLPQPPDQPPSVWDRKPILRSLPQGEGSPLRLSSSEEVDVVSIDEDLPPQSPQYEELLEVVTRAVTQIKHRVARRKTVRAAEKQV